MENKKTLFETHPFIAKIWDYEKNDELNLEPSKLTHGSNVKAHFKCENGHSRYCRISAIATKKHRIFADNVKMVKIY